VVSIAKLAEKDEENGDNGGAEPSDAAS